MHALSRPVLDPTATTTVAPRGASNQAVGTCDLLAFFTDTTRFPQLTAYGVAFIAIVLQHVNTSGRRSIKFEAYPSHGRIAALARISKPTSRKWARYFEDSGWLLIRRRRRGQRNGSNIYDVTPAVNEICAVRCHNGKSPAELPSVGGGEGYGK